MTSKGGGVIIRGGRAAGGATAVAFATSVAAACKGWVGSAAGIPAGVIAGLWISSGKAATDGESKAFMPGCSLALGGDASPTTSSLAAPWSGGVGSFLVCSGAGTAASDGAGRAADRSSAAITAASSGGAEGGRGKDATAWSSLPSSPKGVGSGRRGDRVGNGVSACTTLDPADKRFGPVEALRLGWGLPTNPSLAIFGEMLACGATKGRSGCKSIGSAGAMGAGSLGSADPEPSAIQR